MSNEEAVRQLFEHWSYLGKIKSLRSEYYIFEFKGRYAVLRPDNRFKNSYNITFFEQEKLDKIVELSRGKSTLTTAKLVDLKEIKTIFPEVDHKARQLLLLQAFFVLVRKGIVKMRKKGREISFSFIKSQRSL